ncbi:MAG TPA: chorismate lyase [Pseudomonadales bacterium]|nr:chorismate lyase [Pseudomonadales bacterium]
MPLSRPWYTPTTLQKQRLTPYQREVLLDPGSLTKRMIYMSNNNFSVTVISNRWGLASHHEAAALGMLSRQSVFIREVALCCHGIPFAFARSLFPVSTLRGKLGFVRRFGNKSLGQLLFTAPYAVRDSLMLCQIPGTDSVIPSQFHQPSPVWGRCSRFTVTNKPLLVCEYFLAPFQL